MSKYIKQDDIFELVRKGVLVSNGSFESVCKYIGSLPTIDIVHCGECKCCRDELIEEYMPLYIYCEKWNHETGFDDFCSAGERIEE